MMCPVPETVWGIEEKQEGKSLPICWEQRERKAGGRERLYIC
jgi:hypothetical protein